MSTVKDSIDVKVPVNTAYNQWTQFEEFPKFMEGVKEIRQLDETHLKWHADMAGKDLEWDAEIDEQIPDQRIAWHSTNGPNNRGVVTFEPISDGTRINLEMEYEPQGFMESVGDFFGVVSNRVHNDLEQFKEMIEKRGRETGAWRGEVH